VTINYADPVAGIAVPIKSRTDGGQHVLARDIERLPGTVENDIGDSRGFLETLAGIVSAGRAAVSLSGTAEGYLQSLAGAITAAQMQAAVVSLPGTVAADIASLASAIASGNMKAVLQASSSVIGKLAANVGVNIGTVDVAQLPALLGQANKAGSLSVTIASNQDVVSEPTIASIPASTTVVTLIEANANRKSFSVQNDSTAILYLKTGAGASTTDHSAKILAGGYWEPPCDRVTCIITGIWSAANGSAKCTEYPL
jgi:hypothetical protein